VAGLSKSEGSAVMGVPTNVPIYDIDWAIYNAEYVYRPDDDFSRYDGEVILPALRELPKDAGGVTSLLPFLLKIVSPETSDDEAFRLWHQDAHMILFGTADQTRDFAKRILDVIEAHPELLAD
jgi:hypothetical protein